MSRRLIALALSLMLAFTLTAVPTVSVSATENSDSVSAASEDELTSASETYSGSWPKLPNGIAKKATELAWPVGTNSSKYSYKGSGAATEAYEKALEDGYGSRSGWGAATKAGASCDVFVGTVVRASGYDSAYPRGLSEQFKYEPTPTADKFEKLTTRKTSEFEPGDIILYRWKDNGSSGAHTCIYVEINGKGYIAQANYNRQYGHIASLPDYTKSRYYDFAVYRATGTCKGYFSKGDKSDEVKKLQKFLNWAGFDCGDADGSFGSKTETAVENFQKAVGETADGKFGNASLAEAKEYVPGQKVKTTYSGNFPEDTVSCQEGTKKDIKRWQKFLKWYGYSVTTGGTFGEKTVKYTKKFQKKVNLKADGVVGSKTIKKAKKVKK